MKIKSVCMEKKNKKGSVAITIFVLLTLALTVSTLIMLYVADKGIKEKLKSPLPVSNLYAEKEVLEFYAYDVSRQAIIEGYNEIAKAGEYSEGMPACEEIEGKLVFCKVKSGLKNNFETKVKQKFLTNFNLSGVKEKFREKGIEMGLDISKAKIKLEDNFKLEIENITFVFIQLAGTGEREIVIRHTFDISQEIALKDLGLLMFEDIYAKAEECKKQDFKACMKFDDFATEIKEKEYNKKNFYETRMSSKSNFLFGNEFQPIEILFLINR